MKKWFKKITAVCVAVVMMTTVLCTYAFAMGFISISESGYSGNYTLKFTYSVDKVGEYKYITTSDDSSYSVKFSPVGGTAATINFHNIATDKDDAVITVPQTVSGGMPDSLTTIIGLKPNTYYKIEFKSSSDSVFANGYAILYHIKSYN